MEIRPARVNDAPALGRVHVDSWRAAYRGLVPDSSLQAFTYELEFSTLTGAILG
jgi:hypothetical protein